MRKFLKLFGFVTGFAMASAAAQAETLADALVAAYKTSNLLDQNQAVLRAADEDAAIAVASLRPVLEFAASAGARQYDRSIRSSPFSAPFDHQTSASLELSAQVVLWAGGRGKLSVAAAREQVLAARSSLVNVEQQVLLAAVSAYVDVQLQHEIVALRESNVRVITQELRAARDRFEVGEVTQTDVSLAEAALAASNANLAAAQGQLMVARERYKAVTGHYPGTLAPAPKTPALPGSLEAAKAVAERGHPVVIQAQHQAAAADLNVKIAATAFGPTLGASVDLSKDVQDGPASLGVGLQLSQTVLSGGKNAAVYRKSMAGKEQAEAGLLQAVVQVSETVGQAWAQLAVAHASIEAGRQQVTAAQKAFDGVREEAKLGARTTLDVLNAEQDLLSARAARLEAEANRYVGVYQVLSAMGQLTAEQLNLGVPSFDPEAYYDAVKAAPVHSAQGKALDRILEKIAD
ncbi:TolC family outer membrane protein [Tabrizicola oligotrophica]|uniref:TolC family outer membrane protein n=1 Tax=Tabrizicola oligotrophica TaxID=2710650 RepID=A0A6M0QPE6_9RHOB|nr:TolC family outer membrane protein [Tabrizicola oligotrophica]NEY89358.1 TolC family outer membrane protein [Tabrizicola oligotrophica]